jgi:hypothetical protein
VDRSKAKSAKISCVFLTTFINAYQFKRKNIYNYSAIYQAKWKVVTKACRPSAKVSVQIVVVELFAVLLFCVLDLLLVVVHVSHLQSASRHVYEARNEYLLSAGRVVRFLVIASAQVARKAKRNAPHRVGLEHQLCKCKTE